MANIAILGMAVLYCTLLSCVSRASMSLSKHGVVEGARGPSLDQWGAQWGRRRTLLFMQRRSAEEPCQEERFGSFVSYICQHGIRTLLEGFCGRNFRLGAGWGTGWGVRCVHCVVGWRITLTSYATVGFQPSF